MNQHIKHIVIVGGGAAGWITAGRIAARHAQAGSGITVTLVESPSIGPIGVGEGTWPTMRSTLMKMGISETDFMRECEATFKQGAKFARWVDGSADDYYYHPLMLPQGFGQLDLAPYWQTACADRSFSDTVCLQEQVCEHGLAPKMITTPEYASVVNYAYHLDAGKFVAFLARHCTAKLGVKHILGDVTAVKSAPNGDIAAIATVQQNDAQNNAQGDTQGDIAGDLFIDCTGFSSLLLGKHLGVPFVDKGNVLFIDKAIAAQVPYERADAPIASHTISTGQAAGWIWDIGLLNRRGIGYVYSSRHTSDEQAEAALRAYIGPAGKTVGTRSIPIRSGHRQLFWKNNCVAVGLAAGFLEPLEASALVLVELSADMLAEQLPASRDTVAIAARRFNETFLYRWDRIIDFLKLHYILSKRTDNAFWTDNRAPETIPDSLKDLMRLWRYRPPGNCDFTSNNEVFPAASYQYVLYGMGFRTDPDFLRLTAAEQRAAQEQLSHNSAAIRKALKMLPAHRDLITRIHAYGLPSV